MEVKIGVQHTGREIVLESTQSPDEVEKLVDAAIKDGGLLSLTDEKGRRIVIPAGVLGYVDIGEADVRRVGFTA